jgi:membrane protein YqaA with SNARE-associated domain
MLRRLYDWTIAHAASRRAPWILAAVSFAESSFFPIPPDVLLAPMAMAAPQRAWRFATVCTLASVAGGVLGYYIGHLLYDSVGQWLIGLYGLQSKADEFRHWYAENGAWVILIKGATPIPYKVVTITSGLAGYDLAAFIGLSLITRAARFFLVVALFWYFGPSIRDFVERRLTLVTTVFAVGLVGGFLALRYVF